MKIRVAVAVFLFLSACSVIPLQQSRLGIWAD